MKVSIHCAMFGISAIILPSVDCTVSSYTQELCTTKYGTKSVASVPSTTHALSLEFYPVVLSTLTPVATVTPAATTVNATVFTTSTLIESVVRDKSPTSLRLLFNFFHQNTQLIICEYR